MLDLVPGTYPEGLVIVVRGEDNVSCYYERTEMKLPPEYLQRDPRWARQPYAFHCDLTFAEAGCLTVGLASLAAWAGYGDGTPLVEDFASAIGLAGAYDGCLLVHQEAITKAYSRLQWHSDLYFFSLLHGTQETSYIDWRTRPADLSFLSQLLSAYPVIVEVDYNPENDVFDQHFVLAVEYRPDPAGGLNDDLLIMDPMTGMTSVLTYFNPVWLSDWMKQNKVSKVARTLTGARVWEVI